MSKAPIDHFARSPLRPYELADLLGTFLALDYEKPEALEEAAARYLRGFRSSRVRRPS